MVAEYHNQSKLRFWCQMVLPLVYDDSLSYMELLNKVVNYLNNCIQDVGNCETNIELLLDAFESLQDYVNEMVEDISPEIESVIDQMIENGDFTEILTDALNTVVAPEYDEETTYLQYEYVLYEGNLYRANTTTSGEFDPTKWTEKTIAQDLTVLERYVYGLTANDVPYDGTQTYDAGSTGKAIKDLAAEVDSLDAGDIAYNSSTTYNNATVGKELGDLKDAISDVETQIAPYIENGANATHNWHIGEYIIRNGDYYRVIAEIPNGNAFTNSNIEKTTISEELYKILVTSEKRIVLISDSYGADSDAGGKSWETVVSENLTSLGYSIGKNYRTSGAFCYPDQSDERYFPTFINTLTANKTIGAVLMLCGANDGNQLALGRTTAQIEDGIVASVTNLKTKFPNAKIYLGFCGSTLVEANLPYFKTACAAYLTGATKAGITFAFNFEKVLNDTSLINSNDNVHPTLAGSALLGKYATQYVLNKFVTLEIDEYQRMFTDTLKNLASSAVTGQNWCYKIGNIKLL